MKNLTVSDIMALKPCYRESRVRELFGDRETLNLVEILALDIPPEDRIWVLTRDGVCSREVLVTWIDGVTDRAVRNHCLECGIAAVEAWARGWLDGTDRTHDAAYAAYTAYTAYAADAACAACAVYAADAACAACAVYAADAADAACAACAVYAADAACAACAVYAADAADAAREAERQAQVNDLIRALNDEDEVKARLKGLAAAGYCDRLAVRRLLADLRGRPGCERIQERSLNNYLAGRSKMPAAVEKGLDALIERGAGQ